ncbi:MAG: hypothetical protein ACTHMO_10430 [Rhodanobacteraceae bacterium]
MDLYQPAPTSRDDPQPCGGCERCTRCHNARAQAQAQSLLGKGWSRLRTFLLNPSFWLGVSLSFPLEHFFWEKLWPMCLLTRFLGL